MIKKKITLLLAMLLVALSACASAASIRLGSTGSDVEELQTMLAKLGFYTGNITGHAGEKTVEAIEAFQEKNGLKKDGIAGTATINKLKSILDPNYVAPSGSQSGSSSDIEKAQTMLKALGMYSGQITGNVGSKTQAAIIAFQKKHGLTQSGALDAATMAKLQQAYGGDTSDSKTEEPADQTSASVEVVRNAQIMLKELGLYYGEITGNVGTKTKAAIKQFQKQYGITQSGMPTAETMTMLDIVYRGEDEADEEESAAEEETENEEIEETVFTSLRFGSTGTNVSTLQKNLSVLGYYYGEVTGHYGTKTRAAVRAFQKANGLTADGIAGKKTFAAVQAEIDQKAKPEEEEAEEAGGQVLDLHWFNEKSFYNNHGVKKGATMTVMDIVTGKMFNVRVQSTGYHADVEPKTAADTQIMCDIYGVDDSDDIDWKRRAILVKTNMGGGVIYTYAASMYGEAHGSQTIYDNDYEGQFCIHFRHSTTSETKVEYADNQDPIDKAVNYAVSKMGMTHITDPDQL